MLRDNFMFQNWWNLVNFPKSPWPPCHLPPPYNFWCCWFFSFFFMAKSREITPSPFHHIWYFCNWNAPLYKNSSDLVVESLPYFTSLDKRATLSCFLKSSSFFISCLKLLLPPNKTNKQIQQANKQCMSPSMFLHIMKINFDSPYVLMNCLLDKGGGGRPNVPNPILAMPGLWEHLVSLPLANRKYKVTNLSTEKSSNDRLSQGSTCFHLSPIHGSSQSVTIVSNMAKQEKNQRRLWCWDATIFYPLTSLFYSHKLHLVLGINHSFLQSGSVLNLYSTNTTQLFGCNFQYTP